MLRKIFGVAVAAALLGAFSAPAALAQGSKVRVVIIDGQNNHNWKATTPVIKEALEKSGRFTVDVATSPQVPSMNKPNLQAPKKPKDASDEKAAAKYQADLKKYEAALPKFKDDLAKYEANLPKLQAEVKAAQDAFKKWHIDFDKYDVVVSNYNGAAWSKDINDALEERLKNGKIGLVIVHAANNAFGGWKEYNQMIGMGWRGNSGGDRLYLDGKGKQVKIPSKEGDGSGHRYSGKFQVMLRNADHPIVKGMPKEWMHANDELYDNMRGPIENIDLLATAYSPGTKVHEPMIWTIAYGKGRVFHTPMGHDVGAMKCAGFQSTLARGTEWAATGNVTLAIPENFPGAEKISINP